MRVPLATGADVIVLSENSVDADSAPSEGAEHDVLHVEVETFLAPSDSVLMRAQ